MKFSIATAIFFILSFLHVSNAQQLNEKIDNITLRFSDPMHNHQLIIEIIKRQKEIVMKVNSSIDNRVKKSKIDTTFTIDNNLFTELVNEVIALNKIDLSKAFSIGGYDGTYCTIQFGGNGNSIRYSFWSPNCLTEERGITNFLNLSRKIISTSGLESESII
jgi:hypothetical protein